MTDFGGALTLMREIRALRQENAALKRKLAKPRPWWHAMFGGEL